MGKDRDPGGKGEDVGGGGREQIYSRRRRALPLGQQGRMAFIQSKSSQRGGFIQIKLRRSARAPRASGQGGPVAGCARASADATSANAPTALQTCVVCLRQPGGAPEAARPPRDRSRIEVDGDS
jgi:hypothetical protein